MKNKRSALLIASLVAALALFFVSRPVPEASQAQQAAPAQTAEAPEAQPKSEALAEATTEAPIPVAQPQSPNELLAAREKHREAFFEAYNQSETFRHLFKEDRYKEARVLDLRESQASPYTWNRVRLLRKQHGSMPIRVEDIVYRDGDIELTRIVSEMVADEILVRTLEGYGEAELVSELANTDLRLKKAVSPSLGIYALTIPELSMDAVPQTLGQLRSIDPASLEFFEPNYIRHTLRDPNDFNYGSLWAHKNDGSTSYDDDGDGTAEASQEDYDMDSDLAWNIRTEAKNVVVAVLDTGTLLTHEDLDGNLWVNPGETAGNATDDDANGYVDDINGIDTRENDVDPTDDAGNNGHGTHVAGIIGAEGNNSLGVAGVVWATQLMTVRVFDDAGSTSTADLVEGYDYARNNGAHICNLSLGGSAFSLAENTAIRALKEDGVIVVAAAGNDGTDNDTVYQYPANYDHDNIVTVASTTASGNLSSFSNFGNETVDIAAPGSNILSCDEGSTDGYVSNDGTSMAAPQVSGILAMLKEEYFNDTYDQLIGRLYAGGEVYGHLGDVTITGRMANAHKSLITGLVPEAPVIGMAPQNQEAIPGSDITFQVGASGYGDLSYQWYFQGSAISGATGSTLTITDVTNDSQGTYVIEVSNSIGTAYAEANLTLLMSNSDLADAIDTTNHVSTSGDQPWTNQNAYTNDGEDAAQSGDITHSQSSTMRMSFTGQGTLNFSYKISSEMTAATPDNLELDILVVAIDGRIVDIFSGDIGWMQRAYLIETDGTHDITWTYSKDGSVDSGLDTTWIDQVYFESADGAPAFRQHPMNMRVSNTDRLTFEISVAGTQPMTYEWFRDGTSLGTTDSTFFEVPNIDVGDSGNYWVVATNSVGSATSNIAAIDVRDDLEDGGDESTANYRFFGPGYWTTVYDEYYNSDNNPNNYDSFRSGSITHGQTSAFEVQYFGEGAMTFWWKVSSENNRDFLRVLVNGQEETRISGEQDWAQQIVQLHGQGWKWIRFEYFKDDTTTSGEDAGWVDAISFAGDIVGPPYFSRHPVSSTVTITRDLQLDGRAFGTDPITWQWYKNNVAIPGANNDAYIINDATEDDAGHYYAIVSNPYGSTQSNIVTVTVLNFYGEAIGIPLMSFTLLGADNWYHQSDVYRSGGRALASGEIGSDESSTINTTLEGAGTLSFWWKVDSEEDRDLLTFSIDGQVLNTVSGDLDWHEITHELGAGTHQLSWTYAKNSGISTDADKAWLDDVYFTVFDRTLTIEPSTGGQVAVDGGETTVRYGATVDLTANADPGYVFTHWEGDASGSNPDLQLVMWDPKTVQAHFERQLAAWLAANGLDTDPLATPNADGISNLLAYGLGLEAIRNGIDGRESLPEVCPECTDHVRMLFPALDPIPSDVRYEVRASSDLSDWSEVVAYTDALSGSWVSGTGTVTVSGDGDGDGKCEVSVTDSQTGLRFLRLVVIQD